jgi:holin-like protein
MKTVLVLALQILALFALNQAGYAVTAALHLPLPGNLVGMLLLLALLASGAVPLRWFDSGASLLVRHLAFFFIPISVGLMGFADLVVHHGPAIVVTLVISAGLGIWVAGLSSQLLADKKGRNPQ